MEPFRGSRFLDPLSAVASLTKQKAEAIRLAREQDAAVRAMCRRAKTEVPPYEFEELIGKGAYGRVYKGRQLPSRKVIAIKVMEIDTLDYKIIRDMKDESIKDFIHETRVLTQAKEAGAKNINMLIEAISIHSQLWLVCEYCPGGSVKTLMRATGDRLDEKFIIPIARELAEGLRDIHEAGIIHRDIKAANILVHEEGRLEICDFGVAGIVQSKLDKRSTWIGTPHWMPPEMFSTRSGEAHKYGSEIDVWAYGCTLYEFATGNPPNAGLRERMQIGRQLTRITPKLEGDSYSAELKDLIAFSLNSDPLTRPSMADILKHPYITGSTSNYPTSSLSDLVRIYYQWAQRGGQRVSLFNPGGAMAAEMPGDTSALDDDWNFSTTDGFERRFSIIDLDQLSASLAELEDEQCPTPLQPVRTSFDDESLPEMDETDKANFDERVKRGEKAMEGLFDGAKPTYKYETKTDFVPIERKQPHSDLPLRTETDRSSVTSTFIDINLGAFDSSLYAAGIPSNHPFQLADADTIRANRSSTRSGRSSNDGQTRSRSSSSVSQGSAYQPPSGPRPPTMDWKFPAMMQPVQDEEVSDPPTAIELQTEKRATRDWKFPVMTPGGDDPPDRDRGYMDDVTVSNTIRPQHYANHSSLGTSRRGQNVSVDSTRESRPSTAASQVSNISEYEPFRFDRPPSPPRRSNLQYRNSYDLTGATQPDPGYGEYEGSGMDDGPGPDHEDIQIPEQHLEQFPNPDFSQATNGSAHLDDHQHQRSSSGNTDRLSISRLPGHQRISSTGSQDNRRLPPSIPFPDVQPPSADSLMTGTDDQVVMSEMDRLLSDFLDALNATKDAISVLDLNNTRPRVRHSSMDSRFSD